MKDDALIDEVECEIVRCFNQLTYHNRDCAKAIIDLVRSSGWISVEESQPEQNQRVICCMRGNRQEDTKVQIFRWWEYDGAEVSHWMPIPPLPSPPIKEK